MTMRDRYVRATELIGFEQLVEHGDKQASELLIKAGIEPSMLRDPEALIPFRAFALLHEIAAEDLRRPSFGLEWTLATPGHFPNLGPLLMLARVTQNLEGFLNSAIQYWRYHTNAYTLLRRTESNSGQAVLRYVLDSATLATRQHAEHTLANIVVIARNVTSHENANPTLVRFQHSRPRDLTLHNRIFRCPMEFDAEHTELVFDPAMLSYATPGGLTLLKSVVSFYIRHRIRSLPHFDQTIAATVALAIPSVLGTGNSNIEFIANSIGLSAKRLSRSLAADGTSFTEILDAVRSDSARRFLVESDAPVASIAALLDYSAAPPFILAFKRWTGMSPLKYRKTARIET